MAITQRDRPPKATRSQQQTRKPKPGTKSKRTRKDGVVTMAGFAAAFITPALPVPVAKYVTLPVFAFLLFHLYVSKPVHRFVVNKARRYTTLIQALFSTAVSVSVLLALLYLKSQNA